MGVSGASVFWGSEVADPLGYEQDHVHCHSGLFLVSVWGMPTVSPFLSSRLSSIGYCFLLFRDQGQTPSSDPNSPPDPVLQYFEDFKKKAWESGDSTFP